MLMVVTRANKEGIIPVKKSGGVQGIRKFSLATPVVKLFLKESIIRQYLFHKLPPPRRLLL
jgi:hypothetical protein